MTMDSSKLNAANDDDQPGESLTYGELFFKTLGFFLIPAMICLCYLLITQYYLLLMNTQPDPKQRIWYSTQWGLILGVAIYLTLRVIIDRRRHIDPESISKGYSYRCLRDLTHGFEIAMKYGIGVLCLIAFFYGLGWFVDHLFEWFSARP